MLVLSIPTDQLLFLSELNFFLHATMVNVPKGHVATSMLREMLLLLRLDLIPADSINSYYADGLSFDYVKRSHTL
jgi:hypothetical protein